MQATVHTWTIGPIIPACIGGAFIFHQNTPTICNFAKLLHIFDFFFKQFFIFFMFCCLKSPLLCSLEARHYFYLKVYLKIELQWQKKLHENTTGDGKLLEPQALKKYFR